MYKIDFNLLRHKAETRTGYHLLLFSKDLFSTLPIRTR